MTQLIADAILDGRVTIARLLADEFLAFVEVDGADVKVNWKSGSRGWRCACGVPRCWHIVAVALVAAPGGQRPPLPARPDRKRARVR